MKQQFRRIWNAVTTVLVAIVIVLAILLVGLRLVGFQIYTVLSGSMEPTYQTGSLIYVREVDTEQLDVGDPITFRLNGATIATHRIIEVVADEDDPNIVRYRTKGDANDVVDGSLVEPSAVLGSPVFTVPKLGFLASYIQQPPGSYLALAMGAALILLVFLPDLIFEGDFKKGKREQAEKICSNKKEEIK